MRAPLAVPFGRQIRPERYTLGWVLSAAAHIAVIAAVIWGGRQVALAASRAPGEGPGRGGGGGGGWGRALAVFTVPMPDNSPPPVAPETSVLTVPDTVLPIPEVAQKPDSIPQAAAPAEDGRTASGTGTGAGQGSGTGIGPGSVGGFGGGSGGGIGGGTGRDAGGAGGRIMPPQPQGIILPPTGAPSSLRGVRLTVTFTISERGEVLSVEVDPPIRDRGYRQEFMDRMRRYTFTPAYAPDGRPVRALYPVQITL